jgi:hypothetical protein
MKYILALLAIVIFASSAHAQFGIGMLTYDISVPLDEMKYFIDKTSWTGFGVEGRKLIRDQISGGFSWHFNTFSERTDESIYLDDRLITGDQERTLRIYPILITWHYYFANVRARPRFIPYAGIGVGVFYINRRITVETNLYQRTSWQLGLVPELGCFTLFSEDLALVTTVKYNHAFETSNSHAYNYWGVNIGIAYAR